MEIKDLKLIPPSKRATAFFRNFIKEHDKGLKAIKTLAEIKPILEFYANSKMGEEQPDRTYKIMLSSGYIMVYDPKPAREALRKINEVENEKESNRI